MIDVLEEKKTRKRNLIFWGIVLAVALIYTGYVLVQVHGVNVYVRVQQYASDEPRIVEEKNPFTKYWFLKAGETIDDSNAFVASGGWPKHGGRYSAGGHWVFGIQKGDEAPIFCYFLNGCVEKKVISGITTRTTYLGQKDMPYELYVKLRQTIQWYYD